MIEPRARALRAAIATSVAALQVLFGVPLLLPAPEAQAQLPKPRVWIAPMKADDVPGARLLSEKFDEAVRRQLSRSNALELTDASRDESVAAGESDPRVAQAENLRVAGKAAYVEGDAVGAQEKLRAALKLYEDGLASVNKLEALGETLAFLGGAALKQQFDADAKDYFRRLVSMSPDVELPEELEGPARAFYDKVKAKLLRKKKGALRVLSNPPGAEVRIDGEARGKTPLTIKDLVRGEHYVQLSLAGAGLGATRTRVKGGKTREVTVSLSKELGPEPAQAADPAVTTAVLDLAREGQLGQPFRDKAEAIATQTRADYVVTGFIAPQGNNFVLTAYLYGVQEKQTAAFDEFRFRADLSSVFVQAAGFATAVEQAVTQFPFEKVVAGGLVARTPPKPPVRVSPPTAAPAAPPSDPSPAELAANEEPPPDEFLDLNGTRRVRTNGGAEDEPWYEAWWFWTLVGAAVIGGTAYGGYVLLEDDPQSDDFRATVEW